MAFEEDFATFFDTDEFAVDATLNGVEVRLIFDRAYQFGDVGGAGMASTQPVATIATSAVPSSVEGKALVVQGSQPGFPIALSFTVAAHEPDGTGVSQLFLEKA
ncbi:hypothetical protein PMI15_04677 [Polaromonas sp. CF318]|uniref:head-tail joining protein n=1 Tax=Polaromonas sp. CF318 TaxID=1144318 RepID=UPI000271451A|nr:hypothetical protein [Polaromonas sp. CF318]EJL77355.1 hypothetical protein PMI15_04677 [Polaromonas sp. CF318]